MRWHQSTCWAHLAREPGVRQAALGEKDLHDVDIEIDFDIEYDADQPVYLWGFWGAQWGGV